MTSSPDKPCFVTPWIYSPTMGQFQQTEALRHHAEALLDVRVAIAKHVIMESDADRKERLWVILDHLDGVLDELYPSLDREWGVTEYIEYRWSPANVAYSPADWTDPPRRPGDPPQRRSRDW